MMNSYLQPSDARQWVQGWHDFSREIRSESRASATPLQDCLAYFRKLGLTDEQIRKAITPALFAEVSKATAQEPAGATISTPPAR